MNDAQFIASDFGRVHVLKFGHGAELLIALHGYAERASSFEVLESSLSAQFTVVSIDLPFHGQTLWHKDSFSKSDLLAIMAQVLEKEGKSRFSLLGFSFGARLAQAILPEIATQIDHLFLIAPDGIKTKSLVGAEKTPIWLRRLLYRCLMRPDWFLSLIGIGQKIGVVSASNLAFLKRNLSGRERIQRLFGCWISMESFRIQREELRQILTVSAFNTAVFVGAMDPFIDQNEIRNRYEGLENVQIYVIENAGHQIIGQELAAKMATMK